MKFSVSPSVILKRICRKEKKSKPAEAESEEMVERKGSIDSTVSLKRKSSRASPESLKDSKWVKMKSNAIVYSKLLAREKAQKQRLRAKVQASEEKKPAEEEKSDEEVSD